MLKVSESQQFADRLRGALESAGVRASPTLVANAFNLRYRGRSITPHTARNWLLAGAPCLSLGFLWFAPNIFNGVTSCFLTTPK
ncbi:MAG: hypothetical protein ACK49Q_09895 [Burkholderiales bacterium]